MFNNSYELLNCPISLCCHKFLILAVDHLKRLKSNVILCDTLSCGSMISVYCAGLVQDRERYIFFNTASNSTKSSSNRINPEQKPVYLYINIHNNIHNQTQSY